MGRITKSFRMIFQEELKDLRRYQRALFDVKRRDAFDSLVKAWSSELGAMSYAKVPTALSLMLLTAVVDNRKLIEVLHGRVASLKTKMDEIQTLTKKII